MKKGFTLIELIIVIVILGILATIAIPRMFNMAAKAKAAEVVIAFETFKKLKTFHYEMYGQLNSSPAEIGFQLPTDSKFFNFDVANIAENSDGFDGDLATAGKPSKDLKDAGTDGADGNNGHGNDEDFCDSSNPSGNFDCEDVKIVEDPTSIYDESIVGNTVSVAVKKGIGSECDAGTGIYMTWTPTQTIFGNANGGNCGVYMPTLFR